MVMVLLVDTGDVGGIEKVLVCFDVSFIDQSENWDDDCLSVWSLVVVS